GPQSAVPIRDIYFLPENSAKTALHDLKALSIDEKKTWLDLHEKIPMISKEAVTALLSADIIVYGPGTQYSSLFPSYRIAADVLHDCKALKIFIMNLAPDYDIQSLAASDILDRALFYMKDPDNQKKCVNHVFYDATLANALPYGQLLPYYKNATIIADS